MDTAHCIVPIDTVCQQDMDMDSINALLDKIKESRSIASDNALASYLGATRQAVSSWRNGKTLPDPVFAARIADATGEPLARVIGLVGEARAISREEKEVWRRLASAALIVMMAGPAVLASGLTSIMSNRTGRKRRSYAVCASSLAAMNCT